MQPYRLCISGVQRLAFDICSSSGTWKELKEKHSECFSLRFLQVMLSLKTQLNSQHWGLLCSCQQSKPNRSCWNVLRDIDVLYQLFVRVTLHDDYISYTLARCCQNAMRTLALFTFSEFPANFIKDLMDFFIILLLLHWGSPEFPQLSYSYIKGETSFSFKWKWCCPHSINKL